MYCVFCEGTGGNTVLCGPPVALFPSLVFVVVVMAARHHHVIIITVSIFYISYVQYFIFTVLIFISTQQSLQRVSAIVILALIQF